MNFPFTYDEIPAAFCIGYWHLSHCTLAYALYICWIPFPISLRPPLFTHEIPLLLVNYQIDVKYLLLS